MTRALWKFAALMVCSSTFGAMAIIFAILNEGEPCQRTKHQCFVSWPLALAFCVLGTICFLYGMWLWRQGLDDEGES